VDSLFVKRGLGWLSWVYQKIPGVAAVTEAAYRVIARNRVAASKITRALWGNPLAPTRYALTRWIFLKALGVTYLAAFVSFWVQARGLVGSQGILPAGWSDSSLHFLGAAGVASSVLLILGITPTLAATIAWASYWLVSQVGQDFMSFQWDALMLEMGFFSIFLTIARGEPSRLMIWLMRWLLFRVMFFSGYVKLASHDEVWRNLTALKYHFESQPLPTWVGWWFHQLPISALKVCAIGMFAVELVIPFLYFLPRKPRIFAFFATLALQILIDVTGNYGFFGWQTVSLAVLLLDDAFLEKLAPWIARIPGAPRPAPLQPWRRQTELALVMPAVLLVVFTTIIKTDPAARLAAPLGVVSSYGVFAVMTRDRREIVFEGSRDGENWLTYELPWKPGDPGRRPGFVEPHMPRLDWQLWFAALGSPSYNLWVKNVAVRLLQNSPPVLALFAHNPFPDKPPTYVRARFYQYHFTDIASHRASGAWWRRELLGNYISPVRLRHG
jgi:hypothetical protein